MASILLNYKVVLIFNKRSKVQSLAHHSNKKLTTWINIWKQHTAQATHYLLCAYRNARLQMYKLETDFKLLIYLLLSTVLN